MAPSPVYFTCFILRGKERKVTTTANVVNADDDDNDDDDNDDNDVGKMMPEVYCY